MAIKNTPVMRRRDVLQLGVAGMAAAAGLYPLTASAAAFAPPRPVKLLVPQPPGGAADRVARLFGERLEALWKQSVVVENRPGGGVSVGTLATARSAPDGLTIGLLGSSLSINAAQRTDLPYDLKDLAPVARVGYYTVVLLATASFPANDVKSLIELAKRQGGKLDFGSNGIGTAAQVAGEMLNHMAGIDLQHVPYNGAAKLYTDMIGGLVPLGFAIASSAEPFIKSGQLKVLGVTSRQRSALYPAWPAIAEVLPGYEVVNWAGFVGPAALPKDVASHISEDILTVLKAPAMTRIMADMGIEVAPQGPAEFGAFIRDEVVRFTAATKPISNRMK